jgi:hypothetical protein
MGYRLLNITTEEFEKWGSNATATPRVVEFASTHP